MEADKVVIGAFVGFCFFGMLIFVMSVLFGRSKTVDANLEEAIERVE